MHRHVNLVLHPVSNVVSDTQLDGYDWILILVKRHGQLRQTSVSKLQDMGFLFPDTSGLQMKNLREEARNYLKL